MSIAELFPFLRCLAIVDLGDLVTAHAVLAGLARERQPKLLLDCGRQEAAHRVRLPTGRFHHRLDAGALAAAQQLQHRLRLGGG